MQTLACLISHLTRYRRVVIGYSGGVDSSLLAVAATRAVGPVNALAAIGVSASLSQAQLAQARSVADAHGVTLLEVPTGELADPSYRANAPDRCYFCKRELWDTLHRVAKSHGTGTVLDGTNADDIAGHRPGYRAGRDRGVETPLLDLGFTKADVRRAAREAGLSVWDVPASPCLASRIRYGVEVTPERLRAVEEAELVIRRAGITGNLRVRHLGEDASVEVDPREVPVLRERWAEVAGAVCRIGFREVRLDAEGYRRGALLPVLEHQH